LFKDPGVEDQGGGRRADPRLDTACRCGGPRMTRRVVAAAILAVVFTAAHAQTFPSKPVHIIVPFPPGGAADLTSRVLADHLAKGLGQPVIAENRPGAGAVIGYELGARAPGGRHTLLVTSPRFGIHPAVAP